MKKLFVLFAMLAMLAFPLKAFDYQDIDIAACDVNGDGEVNIADLNNVLGVLLGDTMYGNCDVNNDGVVNYIDLAWVYSVIMGGEPLTATEDQCDFNGDGAVNQEDWTMLLNAFGSTDVLYDLNNNHYVDWEDLCMMAVLMADLDGVPPTVSIYVNAEQAPYLYAWNNNGELCGGWPGTHLSEMVTINRINYFVYRFEQSSVNVIFNNHESAQTGDFTNITEDAFFIYNGGDLAYGLIPPEAYGNPTGEYAFYVNTDQWSQVYAEVDGTSYPMTLVGIDGAGFEVYKWEADMSYKPSSITFNDGQGHGVQDVYGYTYYADYVKGGYYVYSFYSGKQNVRLDRVTTIIYEGDDQVPVLEDCAINLLSDAATWNGYANVEFQITGTYFNQSARKGKVYYSVDGGQYVQFAENLSSEEVFDETVTLSFDPTVIYAHTIKLIAKDESGAYSEFVVVLEAFDAKGFTCTNLQDFDYTGEEITFVPEIESTIEDTGLSIVLTPDVDYTYNFYNNVEPGVATLRVSSLPMFLIGVKEFHFTINALAPVDLTGEIVVGEVTEDGKVQITYTGNEEGVTITVEGYEIDADGYIQLPDYGTYTLNITVGGEGYNDLNATAEVEWVEPTPPAPADLTGEIVIGEVTEDGKVQITYNGTEEGVTITVEGYELDADGYIQLPDYGTYTLNITVSAEGYNDKTATVDVEWVQPTPPVTPTPEITYVVNDDAVVITATGEGTVILYIDGVEVTNPCTINRAENDFVVVATATAQGEDMLISEEARMEITIPGTGVPPVVEEGYFIILIDQYGEEHKYELTQGENGEYSNSFTLEYDPWGSFPWNPNLTDEENELNRPNVPFYFVIDGVRYGADQEMRQTVLGYALQNPLGEDLEGYYCVPVGFSYTLGVSVDNGRYYVYAAQSKMTGVDEMNAGKDIANIRYFNMAGQEMQKADGMTIVVTTYTDGTTSAVKVMK